MSDFEIIRNGYLAEKIVMVDGIAGCGKTLISPIVSSFDRVELLNYAFEIEFICRLQKLSKISDDATISLIRMFTDHKLYQTMMGRETNFRYSDLSSVFKDTDPIKYFKRIFSEGDLAIPEKIKREKPILNLTTHDLLSYSKPLIQSLEPTVKLTSLFEEILADKEVSIGIVCTPTKCHYSMIMQLLNHGKHVFCEKPISNTEKEIRDCYNLAASKNLVLSSLRSGKCAFGRSFQYYI